MPVDIQISDEDIVFAERALLPEGKCFDEERRRFIRRLDTVDLQAVPGSGKTIVLLAKLLIIDRQLPFSDGSGILVISHTNAAVNEIRSRIGKMCPDLFSYPNFIGTIQSFVDKFAAIPCFVQAMGFRPTRIDADAYDLEVSRYYKNLPPSKAKAWLDRKSDPEKYLRNLRFDQELNLTEGIGGKIALISKPQPKTKRPSPTYTTLANMKKGMFGRGLLHFEDVFLFAGSLLEGDSLAKTLLQKRFRLVFVDEMQDMASHQHDLLEELFGCPDSANTVFQRIGDTDQAIFSGTNITDTAGWQQRDEIMTLNNSLRLSTAVSRVLTPFAYERREGFQVNGLCEVDIKPHIIIYDDNSVEVVVERFAQLIAVLQQTGKIPRNANAPFKAVAWNSTWSEDPEPGAHKLRLIDFCPSFQRSTLRKQQEFDTLVDYLICIDRDDRTLASARKGILGGVVRALRLEGIVDPRSERPFTVTSLISYFRYEYPVFYDRLNLYLFRWAMELVKKNFNRPLRPLRLLIPKLIEHFCKTFANSKDFLAAESKGSSDAVAKRNPNTLKFGDLEVSLGTVHSVKGQTHTATLYIESSYQVDGPRTNPRRYESQRLADQFKGGRLPSSAGKYVKESARMVYVGFSRPTHLLAFAVHKERFDSYLAELDSDVWEIVKLCEERRAS